MQCNTDLRLITLLLCQIGLQLGNIPAWKRSLTGQISCLKTWAVLISHLDSISLWKIQVLP